MKNIVMILTVLTIFAFVSIKAGCSCKTQSANKQSPSAPLEFTKEDNGKEIEIEKGKVFTIKLEGNPTTGYIWEKSSPEEEEIIKFVEKQYDPDSDRIGSPGIRTFQFKAVGEGKTVIKLIHHRPWEKEKPPLAVFELHVKVE